MRARTLLVYGMGVSLWLLFFFVFLRVFSLFVHLFLGPSSRHLSLHFGPPGLKNSPRGFVLIPWGTPSRSQKVAGKLHILDFLGFSSR